MSNISVVNLSNYSSPRVVENRNKDYVSYGDDNNYFKYLIDRYNGSPTNNAIINGVSEMIYGKGLDATDSNRKPDGYAQMMSLFTKDCVRKVVYDLKLMGNAAMQIIYSKDRTKVAKVEHMPVETLRAEKCKQGSDIEAYFYHPDWANVKPKDELKRIPAFGSSSEAIEILYIKPYKSGYYYYAPVDYQGGLQYAELEEEIANFHINNIQNGLAPSMLINFNNGIPNDEERKMIEQRIYQKFSGSSNSGKFILAFNDSAETQANVEPVQLSDAHNQYQFLSDESTQKILRSHRIVSPMLFGIKDQTGLGNNADELKTASILTDNTTIRPFQNLIIEHFERVLAFNNISLNLYFKTLQPLEFTDIDGELDRETKEEETGVKMSSDKDSRPFLSDEDGAELWKLIEELGEDEDFENYELLDVEAADDEPEEFDAENYLNGLQLSATEDSTQDNKLFKVRYKYVKGTRKQPEGLSREFCTNMLSAAKLYRKEDIQQMSFRGVNKEHGHKGQNYSLFKWQGGVNCHHIWERRIYKKRFKKDGTPWGGDALQGTKFINVNEAVRQGFKLPKNPEQVTEANIDREDRGHHPNYGR